MESQKAQLQPNAHERGERRGNLPREKHPKKFKKAKKNGVGHRWARGEGSARAAPCSGVPSRDSPIFSGPRSKAGHKGEKKRKKNIKEVGPAVGKHTLGTLGVSCCAQGRVWRPPELPENHKTDPKNVSYAGALRTRTHLARRPRFPPKRP